MTEKIIGKDKGIELSSLDEKFSAEEAKFVADNTMSLIRSAAEAAGITGLDLTVKFIRDGKPAFKNRRLDFGYSKVIVKPNVDIPLNGQRKEIMSAYVRALSDSYRIQSYN